MKKIKVPSDVLILDHEISLSDALHKMNLEGKKFLIILNDQKKLVGVISDGDIRRSILSGHFLNESIRKIMNRNPIVSKKGSTDNLDKIAKKIKLKLYQFYLEEKFMIYSMLGHKY